MATRIAFIGGGNMASAIIGGLLRQGFGVADILVVEPYEPTRAKLLQDFGLQALPECGTTLQGAGMVVWAVKPQTFKDAAAAAAPYTAAALHLSVAAGIPSDSIARWVGTERVVRTMPNTPALIGKGITGVYARPAVTEADRTLAEQVVRTTGDCVWLDNEGQLDTVTALSGSGPAYFFYFLEAMTQAGTELGLSAEQAYRLAVATCVGAGELAKASPEPASVLRERVTSKGGTTYAALTSMQTSGVADSFVRAMHAAHQRAGELGREFGV